MTDSELAKELGHILTVLELGDGIDQQAARGHLVHCVIEHKRKIIAALEAERMRPAAKVRTWENGHGKWRQVGDGPIEYWLVCDECWIRSTSPTVEHLLKATGIRESTPGAQPETKPQPLTVHPVNGRKLVTVTNPSVQWVCNGCVCATECAKGGWGGCDAGDGKRYAYADEPAMPAGCRVLGEK